MKTKDSDETSDKLLETKAEGKVNIKLFRTVAHGIEQYLVVIDQPTGKPLQMSFWSEQGARTFIARAFHRMVHLER